MNNSTYQTYPRQCDAECITWFTVMTVESVAIVTINVVTIIIFTKMRSLRRRAMYLVINLAVADMLVGGLSEVIDLDVYGVALWKYVIDGIWKAVFAGMRLLFLVASITNIAAISLERMHATFFPWRHRVIKKRIYVVTIAIIWVFAAAVVIIYLRSWNNYFLYSFACFCLIIICVSYASIVVKIYCGAHPQHHGAASRERKLTVTLFIMTLVSLLIWLPELIWKFYLETTNYRRFLFDYKLFRRIDYAMGALYYANSLVNPILYAIRMPEFKRGLVSLFHCRPQQRQVALPLRVM